VERKVTALLCGISPWLLGLAPAYIAWSALVLLAWPVLLCYVLAASVELFGTMAAAQALELREYNRRKRASDPQAPERAAWAIAGVYLVASAAFCILHAWPQIARYSLILWPIMGGAAMLARSIRQDHVRRVEEIARQRQDLASERAAKRAEQAERRAEQAAERVAPVEEQVESAPEAFELTPQQERIVQFYREHPDASFRAVAQALERPLSSVYRDVHHLEQAQIIRRNGQVRVAQLR